MLEETDTGSNPHNETWEHHEPGLWANAELNLDPFLDSVIHRASVFQYCSLHHHLIIRSYLFPVLYVLRSLQLMKVHGPKRPVFM